METVVIYFAKVNIALALFYLLYILLFKDDTFLRLRRYYLLLTILFSLIYPLFSVSWLGNLIPLQQTASTTESIVYFEALVQNESALLSATPAPTPISWLAVATYIWSIAMAFFGIRFLYQLMSVMRIKWRSNKINLFGHSIYQLRQEGAPFSFFNWIFVHTEIHSEEELTHILLHEQAHASQWHSVDIMLVEILRIVCWYNPIVWLMKKEIVSNLEFLADKAVLNRGVKPAEYQYHLLQQTIYCDTAVQIANPFYVPLIKLRIMMMNNTKSPLHKVAKYFIVLPLSLLLITANSAYASMHETQQETAPPQEPQKRVSEKEEIFVVVEQQPEFVGGSRQLMEWLGENIQYPDAAYKEGIEGRVIVNFVVGKDGTISDASIVRGIDPLLDEEALRVISSMPKWEPGKQRGQNVNVRFTLPIVFRIPRGDAEKENATNDSVVEAVETVDKEKQEEVIVLRSNSNKTETRNMLSQKYAEGNLLIIVDDVKMGKEFNLSSISPYEIESIVVLKEESALEEFGEEAKNGAILITTKHKAKNADEKAPSKITTITQKEENKPNEEFFKFISQTIKYPIEAVEKGAAGTVKALYNVSSKGEIWDVRITQSVDPLLDTELMRVIKLVPIDVVLKQTNGETAKDIEISALFKLLDDNNETVSSSEKTSIVIVSYAK